MFCNRLCVDIFYFFLPSVIRTSLIIVFALNYLLDLQDCANEKNSIEECEWRKKDINC